MLKKFQVLTFFITLSISFIVISIFTLNNIFLILTMFLLGTSLVLNTILYTGLNQYISEHDEYIALYEDLAKTYEDLVKRYKTHTDDLNAKVSFKERRIMELEDAVSGKIKNVKIRRAVYNLDLDLPPNALKFIRMFIMDSCLKRTDMAEGELGSALKIVGELDEKLNKINEVIDDGGEIKINRSDS